jgi:hypothetical protein
MMDSNASVAAWPPLLFSEWQETHSALHRWMQVLGKLQLACTPWTNHSWHVALSLTARGIGTGLLRSGNRSWQAEFDFLENRLQIAASDGATAAVPLQAQSVAQFHARVREALQSMDIPMNIRSLPCEIADAVPFECDTQQRSYDADAVRRYWRILLQADRVLRIFRARFCGKCSPVHFFWGAMDLAVTRFSGRLAPPHPGGVPHLADWVMREAYSHEVSSCGFWAGEGLGYAAFYAYAYPEPAGFAAAKVEPEAAFYHEQLREFILPYDAVRQARDPDAILLAFLESTYAAAADRGHWQRAVLECRLP